MCIRDRRRRKRELGDTPLRPRRNVEPDRAPVPQARINEMIRAPKVRLVDDDGSQIGIHDYNTKKGHVERFLNQRAKVKVTIMFRGREQSHPERGRDLLMRLAEDVKAVSYTHLRAHETG